MDAEIDAPPVMETKSHLFCTDNFDQQDSNIGLQGLTLSQLDPKINTFVVLW